MIRSRSKSPRHPFPSSWGTNCDIELLKTTRDREELKCMLEKYERHLSEIQGNVKVLTSERDKTFFLYEQAQEEIARLRREMMKSCKSPRSTAAHAILQRAETERDIAFTDLQRITTDRDSLRERLKTAQETAFNEQVHLEQRIEELECTVPNLDDERMKQMSNMTLMKKTVSTMEKEMKSLVRKAMDTKSELGRQKAENNSLRQSTKVLILCEQDISRMRRQLNETNDELAHIAREGDILAHENDNLQEQFSKAKQENQALSKQLNETHNELSDIKQKVQDTNLEVNKLKNILKYEESENRQMVDQFQKANEDAENWVNKAWQAEADNNTLQLELITKKVDALSREVEQHLNAERSYKSLISTLHKSLVKMEEELQKLQFEKVSALADLSSTRELCMKLDSSKEVLNRQLVAKDEEIEMMESELDYARSEIELLRSQMTNERISMKNLEALLVVNRDKEHQSQIALQEKESEIQLLKEHLCLAENKMAIQSRDVAQFRNVVTQLEADLDITKRQLGTERFEWERAVQELRRQNYSSSAYHLSSALKPSTKCHSPERAHHRSPD
ncbi:testis-specific gene 10 protein-like isoform X1 [Molossus molossus]|uniref:testis-specific gene 10 protein-like isoform X1 n=1 Tax=Molossus molossus TaxID=27622 RepID=UPI00174796E3|nr:testis-specific gene 10 protein-like isoform X1 [Molossus molossus]